MKDVRSDLNTEIVWTQTIDSIHWFLLATFYVPLHLYMYGIRCGCLLHTPAYSMCETQAIFTNHFLFFSLVKQTNRKRKKAFIKRFLFPSVWRKLSISHRQHTQTHTQLALQRKKKRFFSSRSNREDKHKNGLNVYVVVLYVMPYAHRYIHRLFNIFLKYTFETLTASNSNDQSSWKSKSGIMRNSAFWNGFSTVTSILQHEINS